MTKHFNNEITDNQILGCEGAGAAKQLSHIIENFNKAEWMKVCDTHMLIALKAKFSQNKDLCSFLKSTGECVLVEANPRDKYGGGGGGGGGGRDK